MIGAQQGHRKRRNPYRRKSPESPGLPQAERGRTVAVVTFLGTAGDACGQGVDPKPFKEVTPAPELRLRGGAETLAAATSTNTDLFSLRFGPSFTFIPRCSFGDELRALIEDGEGSIVADKRVPRSDAATSGAIRYVDPIGRQTTAEEGQSDDRGGLQTVPGHLGGRNHSDVLRERCAYDSGKQPQNGRRC